MRLILRKDVEHLGDVGDVVEVADGYGLNYLIPQGIALHATASTVRAARHESLLREAQVQAARRGAETFAGEFAGVALEFSMRVGEDGRLFGSVTNRMIVDALQEKGLAVDRRKIILDEPIRKTGDYDVAIRLHQDVRASVQVKVIPDEGSSQAAAEEAGDVPGDEVPASEVPAAETPADGIGEKDTEQAAEARPEADEEKPE